MLTLQNHPDNQLICYMRTGKQETPVYWHPKVDKSLRNSVENIGCFFTEEFRDTFELTKEQSELIQQSLSSDNIPEKHQHKFFKIKKHLNECLLSEMDISDTDSTFEIRYPKNKAWAASEIV